ncbi:MAG TPA: EAL domain-containing protein [Acidimicrobiales bacterium]|nr:EAL domain-containing protein [Acidimicrobiales bacterium]
MSAARSAWKLVVVVGLAAVVGYFLLPGSGAKNAAYSVIGLGSVACVVAGIVRRRPADRGGWLAIAAGNLSFVVGDAVYDFYQFVLHRATPFPSAADAFYLAGYPFLIFGVARLTRGRARGQGARESYADAAIVAIGALALSWHFLMGTYAHDATIGSFGKLVNLAYPVLDLGVLFIVVQGLVFGTARRPVHRLLAAAMVSMIVADFVYDLMVLNGTYAVGSPVDAGWLVSYVLVGAAALHPTMALDLDGRPTDRSGLRRRLPLVALAGLVVPLILLIGSLDGLESDVAPLALMALVLFVLVVLRMWWMLKRIAEQTSSLEEALAVRESLEGELRHRAFHDSLTGLANRALLQDRVEHALGAASRGHGSVALCFCDLDGFKTINDSLGHIVGDATLVAAGKRLAAAIRPGDTVARLGGDEFAVLMEDGADPATAAAVAERIVSVMRHPVEVDGRAIVLSVSVGVAIGDVATTSEELLSQADSAMYAAKSNGRDRFEVFERSMLARTVERLELTNAFSGALERGEFLLEYQPQFALGDGQLEGFEALIRWEHPRFGLIGPQRFIPLAEETGHIIPIGRWVIEQACEQAARWSDHHGSPLVIAVNLSSRQLADPQLADDVRTALAMSGLSADQLVLEITESSLVVDTGRALSVLRELKSIGVQLAIDDFGTGYSSLNYLRQFPIDLLKIDKAFVDPLADPTGEGEAFITTIVSLARSLGLHIVAEGIEHVEQQIQLARLGCDSAQGFLMSRPLRPAAATDLVESAERAHPADEELSGRTRLA